MRCQCGAKLETDEELRDRICGLCCLYEVGLQDLALTLNDPNETRQVIEHGRRIGARLPGEPTGVPEPEWIELVPDADGVIRI